VSCWRDGSRWPGRLGSVPAMKWLNFRLVLGPDRLATNWIGVILKARSGGGEVRIGCSASTTSLRERGLSTSHSERFDKSHDQKGLQKKEEGRMQNAECGGGRRREAVQASLSSLPSVKPRSPQFRGVRRKSFTEANEGNKGPQSPQFRGREAEAGPPEGGVPRSASVVAVPRGGRGQREKAPACAEPSAGRE